MKTRLLLLCCLAPALLAAAPLPQTTPNGILIDRVVPFAHLDELDGAAEAPAASLARWRQTLHELKRAAATDLAWPAPRDLQFASLGKSTGAEVPLALIQARYDRVNSAGGTEPGLVFALGALRETVYYGADLRLRLPARHVYSHGGAGLRNLTLDADDGRGPQPFSFDAARPVSYATTGRKTLTLSATTPDGHTLTARALLTVQQLVTPEPTATWSIAATVPYVGTFGDGQAYVYLAPGHSQVTNPVVVVEGFDLDNSMDWPVLYDLLNQQNLLEDLRTAGFDAVMLDFTDATAPIQRNAFVLTELLSQVNAVVPTGKTSVVIGASMGGLVARYGLAWLEQNGIAHNVRTYISFDSPHTGANIPLGVQHWLRFFKDESTDADFLLSRLDTPAARQMLIYHESATSGTTAGPAPERAGWVADLLNVGNWPRQLRLVAVANGSSTGQNQGFTTGDQLILYEYRSLLVDIDGNVWPVPDGAGAHTIFAGMINLLWPLPDTYETIRVENTQPWDEAPGGYRDSMAQMDATEPTYGDIIALHDNHCFVPTVSALAIEGANPFDPIPNQAELPDLTAFDMSYAPFENQGHIDITAENRQWFLDEIGLGVSAVDEVPGVAATSLYPAVPNPFNPRTEIRFELAREADVSLGVYDLAGRLVCQLHSRDHLGAGLHTAIWSGLDDAGAAQASGLYLARLRVGNVVQTGRLMLVR